MPRNTQQKKERDDNDGRVCSDDDQRRAESKPNRAEQNRGFQESPIKGAVRGKGRGERLNNQQLTTIFPLFVEEAGAGLSYAP